MSEWAFTSEAPAHWEALCAAHTRLFPSRAWLEVIEKGCGTRTIYGWERDEDLGVAISVFRAGPFRIGYVGFPVGATLGGRAPLPQHMLTFTQVTMPMTVDLLRVPISAFSETPEVNLPGAETPETAILDLQTWDVTRIKNLYRDIKKATRSGLKIVDASPSSHARDVFRLYQATVVRHAGAVRYNEEYFRALICLTAVHSRVRCLLALANNVVAGFVVVALDGLDAYYLHGATNPAMKQYSPSDLLVYEAITWAQSKGMKSFNLLSSPPQQQSLVRYKEKWGGITRTHRTYELAPHPIRARLFKGAMKVYQSLTQP